MRKVYASQMPKERLAAKAKAATLMAAVNGFSKEVTEPLMLMMMSRGRDQPMGQAVLNFR